MKLTEARLERAGLLTSGLADESVRWKETVETLKSDLGVLLGNAFLASASISYYGPFTGVFREKIVKAWIEQATVDLYTNNTINCLIGTGNPCERELLPAVCAG